eukprot:CAMPEP_0177500690 /NCGR_PEP_ID=MMETSP0369-20130122/36811_1 /TAXON_ID=447022 ORGANISM="Scrippsiella hangoei-like, Strain SHHI-4" /NCGR_SAMPLE_ID=MMETSP0369 /ASSEMBLY_ACC=CAM_ASM_000364 /LENGTH=90 /DNA_ID=CAMNT_0018978117 /DNA_START=49 /DNA_END=321 /DNA_ORIENTATION=+
MCRGNTEAHEAPKRRPGQPLNREAEAEAEAEAGRDRGGGRAEGVPKELPAPPAGPSTFSRARSTCAAFSAVIVALPTCSTVFAVVPRFCR